MAREAAGHLHRGFNSTIITQLGNYGLSNTDQNINLAIVTAVAYR